MDSSIAFGNLGIGELALVVAASLLLLGIPAGVARRQEGEWHTELRRQRYFLEWIAAGAAGGIATAAWTAPVQLDLSSFALSVGAVLLLVATLALGKPAGIRRAFSALSVAAFSLSWGVATDLTVHWVA